jgi:hypothetical protein
MRERAPITEKQALFLWVEFRHDRGNHLTLKQTLAWRDIALLVCVIVILTALKIWLMVAIRANAATVKSFSFHCRACERLQKIRVLLNLKDYG